MFRIGTYRWQINQPMCRHTTFRVGGEAQCFMRISNREQLFRVIPYLQKVEIPFFILGNGSNLLVGDKGYQGVILQIGDKMNQISVQEDLIHGRQCGDECRRLRRGNGTGCGAGDGP